MEQKYSVARQPILPFEETDRCEIIKTLAEIYRESEVREDDLPQGLNPHNFF
jgi:hypothetical protein